MTVGFVIEDNFIKSSFINKEGKAAIFKQSENKDEYESMLIINGNFCYTTKTISAIKLANPKLCVFNNILTKPDQNFVTSTGANWNNRQLMAVLFKKIIHDLCSTTVDQITEAHISLPPNSPDKLFRDIEASLKANGILESKEIDFKTVCANYITEEHVQAGKVCIVNLSDLQILLIATETTSLEGFNELGKLLFSDLMQQNELNAENLDSLEEYLIRSELNSIRDHILSKSEREQYYILLKDRCITFKPSVEQVKNSIKRILIFAKQAIISHAFTSLLFTGRFTKHPLVQDLICEVFIETEFDKVSIDKENELKSKALLLN